MADTSDALFIREFREMMNGRRALVPSLPLVSIPLPSISGVIVGEPRGKMVWIKKVQEPFFNRLNNTQAQLVGRTTLRKRQVLSDGTFRKDDQDNYVVTQIPVPHTDVAIFSPLSIGLKRVIRKNGVDQVYQAAPGFRYIDFIDNAEGRRYIYTLPKDYVYPLNLCALILTPNRRRVFYQGAKLALQDGNHVYLYVVPYKYRDNADARVIMVKPHFDFTSEVVTILAHWISLGVIFDFHLTSLDNQVNGLTNLGVIDLEGTVVADDFQVHGPSLAEADQSELEQAWSSADD